jgi:CheY-like chemotaxis protein
MNVLIAEDDSVSRSILLTKLRKMGDEVTATEDGEAARIRNDERAAMGSWMPAR